MLSELFTQLIAALEEARQTLREELRHMQKEGITHPPAPIRIQQSALERESQDESLVEMMTEREVDAIEPGSGPIDLLAAAVTL